MFEVEMSAPPVDGVNAALFAVEGMVVVVVEAPDVCHGFAGLAVVMENCKNFNKQNADVSSTFRGIP